MQQVFYWIFICIFHPSYLVGEGMDDNNNTKAAFSFQTPIQFSDVAHPNEFLSSLKSMRNHEDLCDVHLLIGSTRIVAHKAVLAANSPYFRAMFTGSLAESQLKEVVIHNEAEKVFSQIIDYFYTSKIHISESNVEALMQVAGLLQLPRLQQACCEVIKRKVTVNNCLGISAFAESHNCLQLAECAHNFAVNHFIEVVQGDEFMKIDIAHMCKLISEDGLSVNSEERVFEVVVAWLQYDYENRKQFAAELFSHVRFPLLSAEFLMERVANEDIIRENRVCCDLLLEATKFLLLPKLKTISARILPRKYASSHQVMYAVGGMSRREAMKTAEKYDPKEGKWKPIGEMSICRFGADITSVGGALYICGGSDDTSRLNTAERYDPHNNVWIPLPEMSSNRNGVGVTMCSGKIYAIGGFNGSTPLNTAECYDTKTGKWSPIASMNQTRFWVGCCTCSFSEQIYAIGGSDGNNLRSCERYTVETNTWSTISSMSVARKQVTCATLNRYIYAIGGCDNATRYQSVERYDPSSDQWLTIAPLISPRSGAGAGVLDGFLYVCGGFDGEKHLNTVEKYDPLTNHWHVGPSMNCARDCVAVCVASHKKPYQRRSTDVHTRSASPVNLSGHSNTN